MSKHKRKREQKKAKRAPFQFDFMPEPYLAGQRAGKEALSQAPTCHQHCTVSAMVCFYLGAFLPVDLEQSTIDRLAPLIIPRILEALRAGLADGHHLALDASLN